MTIIFLLIGTVVLYKIAGFAFANMASQMENRGVLKPPAHIREAISSATADEINVVLFGVALGVLQRAWINSVRFAAALIVFSLVMFGIGFAIAPGAMGLFSIIGSVVAALFVLVAAKAGLRPSGFSRNSERNKYLAFRFGVYQKLAMPFVLITLTVVVSAALSSPAFHGFVKYDGASFFSAACFIFAAAVVSMMPRYNDFSYSLRKGRLPDQMRGILQNSADQLFGRETSLGGTTVSGTGKLNLEAATIFYEDIEAFDNDPETYRRRVKELKVDPVTGEPWTTSISGAFSRLQSDIDSVKAKVSPQANANDEKIDVKKDAGEISVEVTGQKKTDDTIKIGNVKVPTDAEPSHFLTVGGVGSGKSNQIKQILQKIRGRGQRAIVYDPTGEFTSLFYREGRDFILNPLDQRDCGWLPVADAPTRIEAEQHAASLIPQGDSKNAFFSEGARAIYTALANHCGGDHDRLIALAMTAPDDVLKQVIRDEGYAGMIGSDSSFGDIKASFAVYARSLALLKSTDKPFSIANYVQSEEHDSWLFLTSTSKNRAALRPLLSLALDIVVQEAMALRPNPDRRLWLILDELPSLQRLPSLPPALSEARKYGLSCVLGFQSIGQVTDLYGKDLGHSIIGQPVSRLFFRVSDAETADYVSKEIGDHKVRRQSHSQSGGGGNFMNPGQSQSSVSTSVVTEKAVMASEIQSLETGNGFFRTKSRPWAKITTSVFKGEEIAQDVVPARPRDIPKYSDIEAKEKENS